ncbi:uncharacterized protein [Panulirus ornatus]|uniref:uncharacterized protein isoform X5 n=1 Tax=Panulirus ornatus TaxID=150431 RepID=UPI003A858173
MAGLLSKDWSLFGDDRSKRKSYFNQDHEPSIHSRRVNLQQRFSQQKLNERGWSNRLPSTRSCGNPCQNHPHHSKDHEEPDQSACVFHTSSTLPRRPLRNLPSGVAPLWNTIQDNVSQLKPHTSSIFREGGRKMNRALQGVRTSFSSLTQMFRNSTRRRYKLDGETPVPTTRHTSRRTPGRLYSPFNISTPVTPHSFKGPKRLQNSTAKRNICGNENWAMVQTPQHHIRPSQSSHQWTQFHSPSQSLRHDVTALSQGLKEIEYVYSGVPHIGREEWSRFQ